MSEYITKKNKKIDLGQIVSKAMNKGTTDAGKSKPYITKKENKREDKPQYITKKTSEEIREREMVKKAKGGRAGFKSGSKGCKLAMKGKGRAYGKNS